MSRESDVDVPAAPSLPSYHYDLGTAQLRRKAGLRRRLDWNSMYLSTYIDEIRSCGDKTAPDVRARPTGSGTLARHVPRRVLWARTAAWRPWLEGPEGLGLHPSSATLTDPE